MTPQKIAQCQKLLAEGKRISQAARAAGITDSTLRKAIERGELIEPVSVKSSEPNHPASTKAERSRRDAEAAEGMGTACTRADERMAAASGLVDGALTRFERCSDVPMGGLLAGLPALCANGLLSGIGKYLSLPKGFYGIVHILLTMAFMALARIRRPEGLRHIPPGEGGKLIGLDRMPVTSTLRDKITEMAARGNPKGWMDHLAQTWMEANPEEAGYLYIDGHVRVYHGRKEHLPRRYVSRDRLCLRGTTDYWVNDAVGNPFFVISKTITEGLGQVILDDIVPQLLNSVPNQPTQQQLEADPLLHRFVIIADREVSFESFASALWANRIGLITYRKNVTDLWPEQEFTTHTVEVPGGDTTKMNLATRETTLGSQGKSISVIEVRRLTKTGHQTAIITTAKRLGTSLTAGRMFSRWCQENYFAYMMLHFDIDGLAQYGSKAIIGTERIVNPAWRALDKQVRAARRELSQLQRQLGSDIFNNEGIDIQNKADCLENIQTAKQKWKDLCQVRKNTPKKVTLDSLPEDQRPRELLPLNKMLCDTVKMIAYRAETALVALLRPHLKKENEARALIRELFVTSADIEPDPVANTLTIRIHHMASPVNNKAIKALLQQLTELNFKHPETQQRLIYTLG
jgi:hypothetical protein